MQTLISIIDRRHENFCQLTNRRTTHILRIPKKWRLRKSIFKVLAFPNTVYSNNSLYIVGQVCIGILLTKNVILVMSSWTHGFLAIGLIFTIFKCIICNAYNISFKNWLSSMCTVSIYGPHARTHQENWREPLHIWQNKLPLHTFHLLSVLIRTREWLERHQK